MSATTTTEFVLTLTFKGHSLGEIDDAIVNAGGERLRARMTNPPASLDPITMRPAPPTIQTVMHAPTGIAGTPAQAINGVEEPKKETRGRKPGTKNKAKEFSESMPEPEPVDEEEKSEHDMAAIKAHFESGPAVPDAPTESRGLNAAELDRAAQALKHLNSTKNIDAARAALDKFEVKRCALLTTDKLQAFIDHCMNG
jgi:hypothetical protein